MKVVLDTNVLVSAFAFPGGTPERVYRLALEGRIELVTSRPLLLELGRVLSEKLNRPHEAAEALAQITVLAIVVEPKESLAVVKADPDDNRVLEAALEGDAEAIITGDGHLLRLRTWRGIRIVTVADLVAEQEPG